MQKNILQLIESLPGEQRIMVDMLRQIIRETLPPYCREKLSFGVPFFYGHRGICLVWPAAIPRGGIRDGVLLGFWHGNKLADKDGFLLRGTNKQVYYRIFREAAGIDPRAIQNILSEAIELDLSFAAKLR